MRKMRTWPGCLATGRALTTVSLRLSTALSLLVPTVAHASLFAGETLDSVADGMAWAVLVIAPVVGIAAFWLVHILPEKIAEKKRHPQAKAIQTLCLLSLVFGGMLWPIAWLWAYSKPVLYKMAYGTDTVEPEHEAGGEAKDAGARAAEEMHALRRRLAEREASARAEKV